MKNISLVSSLVLLSILGCDSQPSNESEQATATIERTLPKAVDDKYYAARPTINSWPISEVDGVTIANDLSAPNYYLVVDGSGSMAEKRCSGNVSKMAAAKQAVATFTQQIPAHANMGLFVFDTGGTKERVSLAANNREQMLQAISNVRANGGTPLRSAIEKGYESLEAQAIKQLGYGEYHLVVITDGEAGGNQKPTRIVEKILTESPVMIHTIGFCIKGGHSLNQAGKINYKQANDPESLSKGLEAVLAESPSFQQDKFEG